MAAIDTLLKILTARNAKSLIIEPDVAPTLDKDGVSEQLSMPPLGQEMVNHFTSELFPDGTPLWSMSEFTETVFMASDQTRYRVQVKGDKANVRKMVIFEDTKSMISSSEATADSSPHPSFEQPNTNPSHFSSALEKAMAIAVREKASDILFSSGEAVRIRVAGDFRTLPIVVKEEELQGLLPKDVPRLLSDLNDRGSCDLALHSAQGDRFRGNHFMQLGGLAAVLRLVHTAPPTLTSLNLPTSLSSIVDRPYGLVLITGQTGSGKSTTLTALVEHLCKTSSRHIITLEDPIEVVYPKGQALVHQREVGTHVKDFSTGLRAALRESPDVILVGEMRDPETISAAITAAETGHLVLSTLHAASAEMALDRIIDSFPGTKQPQIRSQLSVTLQAIVTQFLLPSTTPDLRVPAYEILQVNHGVSNLIREGRTHQLESAIQTGKDDGMIHLDAVLRSLLKSGRITLNTAKTIARDPSSLTS